MNIGSRNPVRIPHIIVAAVACSLSAAVLEGQAVATTGTASGYANSYGLFSAVGEVEYDEYSVSRVRVTPAWAAYEGSETIYSDGDRFGDYYRSIYSGRYLTVRHELLEPLVVGVTAVSEASIRFFFEYDFFLVTQSFLPRPARATLLYEMDGRCMGCTHEQAPQPFFFSQWVESGHSYGPGMDSDDRGFAFGDFEISGWLNPGDRYEVRLLRMIMTARGSEVPEPASWAMLIAGFGLVGGALRRRRAAPA